jgi:hypothetical protein
LVNLHSYVFCQRGESSYERAYISLKHPFLAIHAKGGESKPKAKGPHHHLILRTYDFQIGISLCSKGGESSIFQIDVLKPS